LLEVLRLRLGMDFAWLGRLDEDLLTLQVVSGDGPGFGLAPGASIRRADSLYARVLASVGPGAAGGPQLAVARD
jgi:hypothetical protein